MPATATAEPLEEPDGLRSRAYGFRVCPPRLLQPLMDDDERKFAHSLKFVLPSTTAPDARSLATSGASRRARCSARAIDPALVAIRSAVSILAFKTTGMPCSVPSSSPVAGFASSRLATSSAAGLSSSMALSEWSRDSIRFMNAVATSRTEHRPATIARRRSATEQPMRSAGPVPIPVASIMGERALYQASSDVRSGISSSP